MKKENRGLLGWLNIKSEYDYTKNIWLGTIVGAFLFALTLIIIAVGILSLLFLLGALVGIGPFSGDPSAAAIRNLGLLIAAVFSAPLLVWRAMVAQAQANTAEQGLITERINKAVEGLGAVRTVKRQRKRASGKLAYEKDEVGKPDFSKPIYEEITAPNLEVRTGVLFALERISQDSPRDYLQIIEIICAYIRENAPSHGLDPTPKLTQLPDVRIDIQTAIKILARRSDEQVDREWKKQFRLDLRNSNLSGVDFEGGDFSAAMFHKSRLEAAIFQDCKLEGTQFYGTILNYANFNDARLVGTRFDHAVFNLPVIHSGAMSHSITMADIHSITAIKADLSQITYLGEAEATNKTFGTKDTILHNELEFDRRKHQKHWTKIRKMQREGETILAAQTESSFTKTEKFYYWAPYNHDDLAIGSSLHKFMNHVGLYAWPHRMKNDPSEDLSE